MHTRKHTKLVHAGKYVAEVDVEIIDSDASWSPYLRVEDAQKLDAVRRYLREGNLEKAKQLGRIYLLKPVAA